MNSVGDSGGGLCPHTPRPPPASARLSCVQAQRGGWARPKEHHLRSRRARLPTPGYSRATWPVRFLLSRRQDAVLLAWLSALILSWALWKPGCSCVVSRCPSLATPLGFLFPDFVFPPPPFVSQDNTSSVTSGAFSRGSSALSQAGRRPRPYLASLLMSGSFLRFWCMRPPCSQGPDCLLTPALPRFVGLSRRVSEAFSTLWTSSLLHLGAFTSHPSSVDEGAPADS